MFKRFYHRLLCLWMVNANNEDIMIRTTTVLPGGVVMKSVCNTEFFTKLAKHINGASKSGRVVYLSSSEVPINVHFTIEGENQDTKLQLEAFDKAITWVTRRKEAYSSYLVAIYTSLTVTLGYEVITWLIKVTKIYFEK